MSLNLGNLLLQISIATVGAGAAKAAINSVGAVTVAATKAASAFKTVWSTTTGVLGSVIGTVGRLWKKLFSLQNILLGGAAVWGIKQIVEVSAAFEGLEASMTAVTKDSTEAAKEFKFAKDQALRLGIDIQTLTKQYIDLLAATRGTALEGDNTKRVFLSIAEAGRVMQLSNDKVREAFLAVQQMMSKGTIQAEEVRKQLGNALPAAFSTMADAYAKSLGKMNLTTEQRMALLEKDMKKGVVRASSALLFLSDELIERYGKGLDKALSKTRAILGKLGNEWALTQKSIGDAGLLIIVKGIAKELINIMQPVREILTQMAPKVAEIVARLFKTDQPKDYFEIVKSGFMYIVDGVIGIVKFFDIMIYKAESFSRTLNNINPYSDYNKELDKQETKLQTIQKWIEKTNKSIAIRKSLGMDTGSAQSALKALQIEEEKTRKSLEALNKEPVMSKTNVSLLLDIKEALSGVKKGIAETIPGAKDFAKSFTESQKTVEDWAKAFKNIKKGIDPILNGLGTLISAQLNALQNLASYHRKMAEESLSYGRSQSEMWMQLADTVHYSNNAQAQSFENRAIAVAEASAKEYQAHKAAQAKANELAKKSFENQKQLQMIQAVISTATAVMQTYTNSGLGLFAAPLAGAMAAIGAAQISLISRQQYTPREKGGSITGGKPYLVGEKGPEMIIPGAGGTVVNNKDLMNSGGGDVNVTMVIQAYDTKDGVRVIQENRGMIINIMKEAQNRGMGRAF